MHITKSGRKLLKMRYKERQLEYVKLMLEHQIFHELFEIVLRTGCVPEKRLIAGKMRELQVCSENLIDRRASSVRGWLQWILERV